MKVNKSLLTSKTFWFGVVTALAPLFPDVTEFMTDNPEVVAGAWGLVAIILRSVTSKPVSFK